MIIQWTNIFSDKNLHCPKCHNSWHPRCEGGKASSWEGGISEAAQKLASCGPRTKIFGRCYKTVFEEGLLRGLSFRRLRVTKPKPVQRKFIKRRLEELWPPHLEWRKEKDSECGVKNWIITFFFFLSTASREPPKRFLSHKIKPETWY